MPDLRLGKPPKRPNPLAAEASHAVNSLVDLLYLVGAVAVPTVVAIALFIVIAGFATHQLSGPPSIHWLVWFLPRRFRGG